MIHLGDITKINGAVAPIVDCIIGGSPCQDLSIAGKRAGLAGERSGLYMEQIRVIREMREHDRANGRSGEFIRPRYMVWENVPGAFSSNHGKDFAAVLEEAVKIAEPGAPPVPVPEKGWPTSGCLMGDGWSVAWRVLDAQFWGVPQRRRRIVLIADFGGLSAPEILFIRKSVSGDSEPGSETREGFAGGSAESTGSSVYCLQGNGIDRADTARCNGRGWKENVSYTLNTIDRPAVCAGFKLGNSEKARSIGYCEEQAPALNAECGGNKPAILDMSHACDVIRDCGGISPSLQARMGTGGNQVPLTYQMQGFGDYREGNVASSCKQRDFKGSTDLVCAVDCRNGTENADVNGTLQAKSNGGTSYNLQNVVRENMLVRRLTPLEYERLQGFPDGWTDIGEWVDSKGKAHKKSSDSSRYKALGNSIALPPWKWVLKRLCAQYERDATMASLFDGIGGFPLIWEQLNGKGSCLWASEIEEFPMAVTKKHFG
jgi:DNA (cytosine-5)-methyltransferase 1